MFTKLRISWKKCVCKIYGRHFFQEIPGIPGTKLCKNCGCLLECINGTMVLIEK